MSTSLKGSLPTQIGVGHRVLPFGPLPVFHRGRMLRTTKEEHKLQTKKPPCSMHSKFHNETRMLFRTRSNTSVSVWMEFRRNPPAHLRTASCHPINRLHHIPDRLHHIPDHRPSPEPLNANSCAFFRCFLDRKSRETKKLRLEIVLQKKEIEEHRPTIDTPKLQQNTSHRALSADQGPSNQGLVPAKLRNCRKNCGYPWKIAANSEQGMVSSPGPVKAPTAAHRPPP